MGGWVDGWMVRWLDGMPTLYRMLSRGIKPSDNKNMTELGK